MGLGCFALVVLADIAGPGVGGGDGCGCDDDSGSSAPYCGDWVVQEGEECEPELYDYPPCSDFIEGAVGYVECDYSCTFDTSYCEWCGDGYLDGYEECEGADLGGDTCETLGFAGGTLACTEGCTLDTTDCTGLGQ